MSVKLIISLPINLNMRFGPTTYVLEMKKIVFQLYTLLSVGLSGF